MLYNVDLQLWQNFRESRREMPNGGAILKVHNGMVSDGLQVLGRFATTGDAEATLKEAGFIPQGYALWK